MNHCLKNKAQIQTSDPFAVKKNPVKSYQDAVENIKKNGRGSTFAIEGDIDGAYNTLVHDNIIKILEEKIRPSLSLGILFGDNKFLARIKQLHK